MINLSDVSYVYMPGGPFEKVALDRISLTIHDGEFIGLIGHTGSGKSTLIQMLNGLLKPTSGTITVDGQELGAKDTDLRKLRFDVGLVMQYPEYQLFEETVAKDIAFGPANMGLSEDEIEKRVERAAAMVGLSPEMLEASPFDLSGGQKRRVAIAGVLAMEPKILILDEPTAGLDPAGRDEILYNIKEMHEKMKMTVILVSHSMEDIAKLADRILVMNQGSVEMFDKTEEIFRHGQRLTQIGLSIPQITRIMDGLHKQGVQVEEGIYTMEEAYRQLSQLMGLKEQPLC